MTKRMRGNLLLLLAAFIWGIAFVAQSEGMKYVEPFTFLAVRSFLGSTALCCFLKLRRTMEKSEGRCKSNSEKKTLLMGGICCGTVLFVASALQQIGISYSPESGKAGFITALYIVLVPACGSFTGKKVRGMVWFAVLLSLAGMYLLCITDSVSLEKGDVYLLLCAVAFTVHILVVDYFSPKTEGVAMSCIQFLVCGVLGTAGMIFTEQPAWSQVLKAWLPLVYAGVLSSGVAYTLQIIAQKDTAPAVASLIMSLESVFAVLGGWIILGQVLSVREFAGCGLMFTAILLTQMPFVGKIVSGEKKAESEAD